MTHDDLDPGFLVWSMHRRIDTARMPPGRTVIELEFTGAPRDCRRFWLVHEDGKVDMCVKHPGFEVDLAGPVGHPGVCRSLAGDPQPARRNRGTTHPCLGTGPPVPAVSRMAAAQRACPVSAETSGARIAAHAHADAASRTRRVGDRVSWRAVAPARPKSRCHDPADRPRLPARRGRRRARAGAVAGQAPAQLLLARAVHPAADDGPVVGGVHAVGRRAHLQHGRFALAPADRRQRIAIEITHADGAYDHQPDVAPDGQSVVFSRYDGKAFELWRHDFASGHEQALTANGGVNLEPRISPNGRQIVFVSTARHRALQPEDRGPLAGRALERALPRRAAREHDRPLLLFDARSRHQSVVVAGRKARLVRQQRGDPLGHGLDLLHRRRRAASPSASTSTSSRRPGPRGRKSGRTASASCSRTTTAASGTSSGSRPTDDAAPLPLTYGEFDRRNARWSPDGKRIAYISNEDGNTSLWVQEVFGGARTPVKPTGHRHRLAAPRSS